MEQPALPRRERTAVRAILLDPGQHVLLLRGRDPASPDSPAWWFTPGGGIGHDEAPLTALQRECWEELGVVPNGLAGPLAHRCYEFPFDGHWLVQQTDYYWARTARFRPSPQRLSPLEKRFLLGWRWWPRAALTDPAETIYPEDLTGLVALALGESATG